MASPHFLLVTFPAQGHINPSLQFSKRLVHIGARVTFVTAVNAHRRMADSRKNVADDHLTFATFSDGYDEGPPPDVDVNKYMAELEQRGSQTLRELIVASLDGGRRFTCVFYTTLMPWVSDVATSLHIPSTLVWIQPATVFGIYYYYFNGYEEILKKATDDHSSPVRLPSLPLLNGRDIPSFFGPRSPYSFSLPLLKRHFEILNQETNPTVLVNTFDALEPEASRAIDDLNLRGIGPLIPSAFLDGQEPSDTSFGGDLFQSSNDYIEWLNTKPKGSVIYVSFGSISVLSKRQEEELAHGLLASGRPFLWVIRNIGRENNEQHPPIYRRLEKFGMIVPWCSQVEVLSHPSVGCFVTHCGWNSTSESLVCGVPVVAFPQWSDQHTNAKLIEDVWRTGVRVNANGEGIVDGEEIKRCLELVVGNGEKGKEMRENARKWRELAMEASKEGGSSYKNLRGFIDEITRESN